MITAENIAEAEKECFEDAWSVGSVSSLMSSDTAVIITENDGDTLLGYALGAISADECELYRIAVLRQYRRTGLGQKLLAEFIGQARKKAAKIFLEVRADNKAAISLYEKNGFLRIAVRKMYYGDTDALIYELDF